ncbi:MAG: 4Fe-4S binding domain [Actinomycetota bacterium]|jgi:ferredoxin
MTVDIVVIGSGPSALATVRTLTKSKLKMKIKVLDIENINQESNPVGLKTYFGSTSIYDQEESKIHHSSMKPVVWPSSGRGGFSRIWGAVISAENEELFQSSLKFGVDRSSSSFATNSAIKLKNHYQLAKNPTWELIDHRVAVDPKLCIRCGNCLTGCPTDAIWFAGNEWSKFSNVELVSNFRAQELEIIDDKAIIKARSGAEITADWVFVGAGAIASIQILMRSNLIPNSVNLNDTNAVFFPALRFPVRENRESFSLSQLSAKLFQGGQTTGYVQFYPDSRKLLDPIIRHNPVLGKIFSKLWFAISPFLMSGILYLNKKDSEALTLTMLTKDSFEMRKNGNEKTLKNFLKKNKIINTLCKDFGIFPLFLAAKKGEPGESYHFGAVKEVLEFNARFENNPIRVVDGSALLALAPGPITDKIMKNAELITKQALERIHEISD